MKKIFLLFVATLSIWNASAQELEKPSPVKYQGEVEFGYSLNLETEKMGRFNLHTIQGIRIGEHFSTGIGTGLDYYHNTIVGGELVIPVYVNMKGYLPKFENIQPFLSMDMGMGFGVTEDIKEMSGGTYGFAIGVVGGKFKAQIGYNIQSVTEEGVGIYYKAIQFKFGFMF